MQEISNFVWTSYMYVEAPLPIFALGVHACDNQKSRGRRVRGNHAEEGEKRDDGERTNERTESTLGNGCFFYASDSGGGGAIAVFGKPPNRERDRRARSSITNAFRKADSSATAMSTH